MVSLLNSFPISPIHTTPFTALLFKSLGYYPKRNNGYYSLGSTWKWVSHHSILCYFLHSVLSSRLWFTCKYLRMSIPSFNVLLFHSLCVIFRIIPMLFRSLRITYIFHILILLWDKQFYDQSVFWIVLFVVQLSSVVMAHCCYAVAIVKELDRL